MRNIEVSSVRKWLLIPLVLLAGLLVAAALRFGILENESLDLMCSEGNNSGWCSMQSALGWSIHYQLFGLVGLFLGIAGWLPLLHRMALPGLFFAGCGLLLYNTTYAAIAAVIALLAALRSVSAN